MDGIVAKVRRGFFAALLPRGAIWGLAAASLACSPAILVLRLAHCALRPVPFAAIAAFGAAVGTLLAARRVPSRDACRAMADDVAHAGGLILVAGLPGSELWPLPGSAAVPLPPRRLKRPLLALGSALLACLAAGLTPLPQPPAARPVVPVGLIEAAESEIERLAEEAEISEEELAEIREEVRRIVEAAPGAGAAETVDALARVADRLRLGDAISRDAARRAQAPRKVFPTAEESAALRQALSETLAQSPSSADVTDGRDQGDGSGQCEGNGAGNGEDGKEGGRTGAGGPARGPGAAIISWTDPASLGASALKDIEREADPVADESVRIGEVLDEWDHSAPLAAPTPGAGSSAPRAIGASWPSRRVMPRHREAVRRYFSTERND